MKNLYYYLGILPLLVFCNNLQAQCTLNTFATNQTITCGECTTLSAFGNGSGNVAFQENFNSGSPVGWQFTQTVTIGTNTCGVPSPDGTPFMWMGDASVNPRDMTTVPFNLTLGGTVCFEMRYAIQGQGSPCEGPDEPQEGVYIQYSTNGGTTWTTIQYWDPNGGGASSPLTSWNQYCVALPPGALTANTQIRWHQDNVSGATYDHWGIDNVIITLNDPNYTITWLHDGYSYGMGSPGGNNPTAVCPTNTTTYNAQITDGTNTCTSAVTITVVDPVLIINPGNDTTICTDDCITLNATAYEQVSPASTPTFSNSQISIVTGGNASMNINVQGLNQTTLNNNSITSVCLTGFNFSGAQLCTSLGGCNCNGTNISAGSTCNLNVSSFNITLTTPDGCSITLVPAGIATGTSYTNVCFVPAGGQNITGGGFPAAGSWNPNQPFSNLNGCNANGVWTMRVNAPGGLGFGFGALNGWSISFDDPEIKEPVNYTWSPTTNMTNSNTLTPTICPTTTTTYTLTATDTDGCITRSEDITVTVAPCCTLEIDNVPIVNPDCNTSNGQITVQYSGETTGLQFSINGGTTYQSSNVFSNLPAGTYNIKITDDSDCSDTLRVTLTSANGPVPTVNKTDPTCGNSDGTITITATGGTAPIQYSIDGGTTFVTTGTFTGLPTGPYNIVVTDNNNCEATQTINLVNLDGPSIDDTVLVNPDCGASNGSITVTATGGVGALTYHVNSGSNQASGLFTGLGEGTYTVVVADANGCQVSATVQLTENGAPSISAVTPTNPACGANDGIIAVTASGGAGTLQYTINGGAGQTSSTFNGLDGGSYTIVVTDANGCNDTETVQLTEGPGPSISGVNTTPPNCGATDGQIVINASGGTAPLTYSINNGATSQASGTFNNIGAGTYNIVVSDANGCEATQQTVLNTNTVPNVNAGPDVVICAGDPVTLTATGAATYAWTGGVTNGVSFVPTTTMTYTVTGTDAAGCINTDVVTVTVVPVPDANFTADITIGNPVLNVTFTNTSTNATGYVWNFGNGSAPVTTNTPGSQNAAYPTPGVYTVQLTASNGNCIDIFTVPITVLGSPFDIYIPNVFTPNGDGVNDEFFIDVTNGKSISVKIFNRWGNAMFEMNDFNTKWDGKDANEGVYFFTYTITGMNGESREGHGNVTLVRK